MPLRSPKSEEEILDFIFRENSSLETKEQEKRINTYYTLKYHIPKELFKEKKILFNYNKGLTYLQAIVNETVIFKLSNTEKESVLLLCPPEKEFVKSLDISDTKKDQVLKKYKDTSLQFWQIELSCEEALLLTSSQWDTFKKLFLTCV